LPGGDNETTADEFNKYFKDFLDSYEDCRDSEKNSCWCTKDKLNIPRNHILEVSQRGSRMGFELVHGDDLELGSTSVVVQNIDLCFLSYQGKKDFDDFEDSKVSIRNGDLIFRLGGVAFENGVDTKYLFYKDSNGDFCMIDKVTGTKLKDKGIC
jgi:hypothetical protein